MPACNTCRVYLDDDEGLSHYKSEWHRYNVKRRCAQLKPITIDQFNTHVLPSINGVNKKNNNVDNNSNDDNNNNNNNSYNDDGGGNNEEGKISITHTTERSKMASAGGAYGNLGRKKRGAKGGGIRTLEEMHHRYNDGNASANGKINNWGNLSVTIPEDALPGNKKKSVAKPAPGVKNLYCNVCGKKFASENAYAQHMRSKKHLQMVANGAEPKKSFAKKKDNDVNTMDVVDSTDASNKGQDAAAAAADDGVVVKNEQGEEGEEGPVAVDADDIDDYIKSVKRLELTDCLFCRETFPDFKSTMEHMTKAHSFFLPNLEYCTDLEGLYLYLADKIAVGRTCICCNKSFSSVEAVRGHMRDKAHWKVPLDCADEELQDFYDFASSYPEGAVQPGEDSEEALAGLGSFAFKGKSRQLILPPGAKRRPVAVVNGGYGIKLSDGSVIGHRSLRRYYRQSLPGGNTFLDEHKEHIQHLRQRYKMLGLGRTGDHAAPVPKNAVAHEKKSRMQLGVKGNKQQHYFRMQNPI